MNRDVRINSASTSRFAASGNASNSSMMCFPWAVTSAFYPVQLRALIRDATQSASRLLWMFFAALIRLPAVVRMSTR